VSELQANKVAEPAHIEELPVVLRCKWEKIIN